MEDRVPSHQKLRIPVFQAFQELGGEATQAEIVRKVAKNLGLSERAINQPHRSSRSTTETELEYRIGWARSYLKKFGIAVKAKKLSSKLSHDYLHASIDLVEKAIKEIQ